MRNLYTPLMREGRTGSTFRSVSKPASKSRAASKSKSRAASKSKSRAASKSKTASKRRTGALSSWIHHVLNPKVVRPGENSTVYASRQGGNTSNALERWLSQTRKRR
jgi:hypothetical protein